MTGGRRAVFGDVRKWRAADKHTGIDKLDGIPYTYEHVAVPPVPGADVYRVECFIELASRPLHREAHYVLAEALDDFFSTWGEIGAVIVDIRPMTVAEARAELAAFRDSAGSARAG